MSEYLANVEWIKQPGENFLDGKYSRGHTWQFDGGVTVPASSSPSVLPEPMSVAANVDPEEAFVASLSSCHMLWFLALAVKYKFAVESYKDNAVGIMAKNAEGKLAMTEVTLRPTVEFSGDNRPSTADIEKLHHEAHERCFIANSVKTDVRVEADLNAQATA